MLTDIFGPVITTLTQGGDPNSQQISASIIATMFNSFNTGILAVAGIIVGYVALMGVANTANDGEAFGKAWSTWWTPARIIYGGGAMLPTTSGYSIGQIIVFTIALWAIGFANTIYTAAFTMSVVTPTGLISGINQPGAFFGLRDFAKNYLQASYCAHAANAIYNPSGGSGSVNFENYSTYGQADYTSANGGYSNAVTKIQDRGSGFVDAGQGACGVVTLSTYTAQIANEQSSTNSGTTTTTSTDPMGQALENLHQTVQGYKVQAAISLMQNIDSWVATWPNTANDPGWSNVNSSQFNTYVSQAENQVATQLAQAAQNTSSTTNSGLQTYVQAMTVGGWVTAGGWFQRVGQLRGQFTGIMADPVGNVTPPAINEFPTGDAGTPELDNSIEAVINAINQKADMHATVGCSSSSSASNCNGVSSADLDLSGALPKSVKDLNVATLRSSLDGKMSTWINYQMGTMVSIVTGANTQGVNGASTTPLCGTAGQIGGALNRMKCVGDYLTVIHGTMLAADGTFKVALTAVRVTADALSTEVLGNKVDTADMGTAGWDLYIQWLAPLIGGLIAKTAHLAFLFGVFLPSLPYLLFMMVVAGWILSVLMAALAVTLWMCMHMTPERTFVGSQSQGYLLLLSLFARPALAVIGLIAAFIVSDPIINYIATSFFQMRAAVVSSTGTVGWFAQFESFTWWFEMFGIVLLPVLYLVFGLPQALPGHVLEWIGGGVRDLGETNAQHQIRGGYDAMSMRGKLMPGMGGVGALTGPGPQQGGGPPRRLGGGSQSPGGSIDDDSGGGGGPGPSGSGGGGRRQSAVNVGPQGVTSAVNAGPDGYNPPAQNPAGASRNKGSYSEGLGTAIGRGLVLGSMAAGRSAARVGAAAFGADASPVNVGSAIRQSASDMGGAFRQASQDGQAAIRDGVGATLKNIRGGGSGGANTEPVNVASSAATGPATTPAPPISPAPSAAAGAHADGSVRSAPPPERAS
jgi:conjugal transfer/type IV secretion protein DotA/TraY